MEGHKWLGKAFKWPTEPWQNHTITICVYFFKSFQCVCSECTHWNDLKMEPVSRYNLKTNLGILLSHNRVVISYKIPIMPSKCIQINVCKCWQTAYITCPALLQSHIYHHNCLFVLINHCTVCPTKLHHPQSTEYKVHL